MVGLTCEFLSIPVKLDFGCLKDAWRVMLNNQNVNLEGLLTVQLLL